MSALFGHEHPYEQTKETIGSMMFRTHVTLRLARSGKHGNELKARFIESARFMEAYDFESAFKHAQDTNKAPNKQTNEEYPYENHLYRALGDICLSGSEGDVSTLIWNLVNPYGIDAAPGRPQGFDFQNQPMNETNTQENKQEDNEHLPRYSSILNERGQEEGIRPQKEVKQLAFDPPQFKATVRLGQHHGTGVARNKKQAGHLAAKDLCHQLGIRL
ncbi:hypothetical protein BBP40_004019 [Aspergillus hancockii]|nr:hypothetical protein BBP40_004019 [Aspergillus hancockii]